MPRIMLTLSPELLRFLDGISEESGIDRSNLIRSRLWEWRTEERDRRVSEGRTPGKTPRASTARSPGRKPRG